VVGKADYVGSTSQMLNHVRKSNNDSFFLVTECGLTGVLQSEFPQKTFAGSCTLCKYMKSNSLEDILNVLENPSPKNTITLDPETQVRALQCVNEMFHYSSQ
jgi:quinolinate synthase